MLQSGCICQAGDSACISSTLLQDLLVVPICISLAAPALLPLLYSYFTLRYFMLCMKACYTVGRHVSATDYC